MESPLFPPQLNRTTLKQKIIELCKNCSDSLGKQGAKKTSKTFFVSQANQFIQKLIHLHSKEVNLFIKNHLKKIIEMIHTGTFQQITNQDILIELSVYSKQKNFQKEEVFNKLQKIFNYYLLKECIHKSKIQIQNVELQIQCSLNYTCPICIKQGEHSGLYSLKIIENEVDNINKTLYQVPKTMKQINFNEMKENDSISSNKIIVDRPLIFKLKQTEKIVINTSNKQWNTFGNLLGLQINNFLKQIHVQSNDVKSQRLFNELQLRNSHNETMIKNYCRKLSKIEKKQFIQSLYTQYSHQINQNQHSIPLKYFPAEKVNSFGDYSHTDHTTLSLRHGISDRKKNILKPLANLHHTIQFDKSFSIQNANRAQRPRQANFTSRKVHFDLNSPNLSLKKGRLLVHQQESIQLKNKKLDIRAFKKQPLPYLFKI